MDQLRSPPATLERRVGPLLLTLYGVGVMVGAGIYVLVGAVAGSAGLYAPLAFLLAGLIAAPTAFSYAELSVRVPESAGEAAFVRRAFSSPRLSLAVGLAIVAVGSTSAAAVLQGGIGYLRTFTDAADPILVVAVGGALAAVALWGVRESLTVAALLTAAEVIGLVVVVGAGLRGPASPQWAAFDPVSTPVDGWSAMLAGLGLATVLAFFAFVGFEDMVNMVEEVERPDRTMPVAIIGALVVTCLLYGSVSIATVRAVDPAVLADSDRPLALVYEAATGGSARFLSGIAVVAALNGVLAQMVMASRVLFGLGRREPVLARFHRVHPRTGTPVAATVLVGALVIAGALVIDLTELAEATSSFLLAVFLVVNASLLRLKRRGPSPGFTVPSWVPLAGLLGSAAALVVSIVT